MSSTIRSRSDDLHTAPVEYLFRFAQVCAGASREHDRYAGQDLHLGESDTARKSGLAYKHRRSLNLRPLDLGETRRSDAGNI